MRLEKDNAIRLFNCEAPGSEGIKLEEIFYEEKMEDGRIKKVVQHVLNPEMVPYIPSSSKDKASQTPSYKALATNRVILFKKSGRFIVL